MTETMQDIERENALMLADYFQRRANTLRSYPHVLASEHEFILGQIDRYETKAAEIRGKWE